MKLNKTLKLGTLIIVASSPLVATISCGSKSTQKEQKLEQKPTLTKEQQVIKQYEMNKQILIKNKGIYLRNIQSYKNNISRLKKQKESLAHWEKVESKDILKKCKEELEKIDENIAKAIEEIKRKISSSKNLQSLISEKKKEFLKDKEINEDKIKETNDILSKIGREFNIIDSDIEIWRRKIILDTNKMNQEATQLKQIITKLNTLQNK
ncbi:hypothetical protein [Mycoplasma todarodis]|uniref:Lipoprotein n=1 Tax=Mycoplasma todarodis TaxID=1937191 RepID=A0A4R0XJH6_9MOLU|nr:hypothetical protein [Mycoplasma todarodis]TCG10773.1 hypothetical protein C4B25_03050 [Mycoplasma todarodis]